LTSTFNVVAGSDCRSGGVVLWPEGAEVCWALRLPRGISMARSRLVADFLIE